MRRALTFSCILIFVHLNFYIIPTLQGNCRAIEHSSAVLPEFTVSLFLQIHLSHTHTYVYLFLFLSLSLSLFFQL